MNESDMSQGDLFNAIHASRGMQFLNRSHQRTFSLDIFRMNAQELIDITRRISDPDEGIRLMSQNNRAASQQTHREVTRRVHNFVAAALTLVDHTRIFVREHYARTPLSDLYQKQVDAELANEPLVKFVQDLRNFMLHKGLPNSEMFLTFQSNPDLAGSGDFTTGIRIRAAPLLEWDRWTVPARTFIEGAGEFVDIRTFAEIYTDKIVSFHEWLQGELANFHKADLDELGALQASMNQFVAPVLQQLPLTADSTVEAPHSAVDQPEQEFIFETDRAIALDTAAEGLLQCIRKIVIPDQRRDGFPGERPVAATITPQEMIGAPLFWGNDVAGRRVFVFVYKDGGAFGLDEEDFARIQTLIDEFSSPRGLTGCSAGRSSKM